MSASREKKKRRENLAQGLEPKLSKREQDLKKDRHMRNIMLSVVIVIAVLFGSLIFWNSGILQARATAVTVGDEKFTAPEFNFYYYSLYHNYVNTYGDYLSMLGLDTSKPLNEQQYSDSQTWADYFRESALSQMQETIAMAREAEKNGFTLSEDAQSEIDSYLQSIESYCSSKEITVDYYFTSTYGDHMTQDIFVSQLTNSYLASEYTDSVENSYAYTDDDITAYYEKNPDDFDVVTYKAFKFDGSVPEETADTGTDTETETSVSPTVAPTEDPAVTAAKAQAAMDAAKASADEMAAKLEAGGSFTDLATEYTPAGSATTSLVTDKTDAAKTSVSSAYQDWLFDSTRISGDITVAEDTDNSAYYVVLFESRGRFDYNTVNVRHILIKPEVSDGASEATDEQKAAAKSKAEEIYQTWKDGDATESSFADLAKQYSEDTGSSTNGGLYENVYKGQMVTAFNDWIFDSSRKAGDTGIVESTYGYHVMYFSGFSRPYWKIQVENAMRTADYNSWHDEMIKGYDITTSALGMSFAA